MDILRPPLVYVDGRCYRINNPDPDFSTTRQCGVEWDDNPSSYENNDSTLEEPCYADEDFEITVTENGRFKTSFHVARVYYAPIIGARGQTKKRIEDETRTIIKVPRQPQEHEVMITGPRKRDVASARRRVELIVMSCRKKQPFTHFVSMPMVSPSVKERFLEFKCQVLQKCQARGVEESIFQDPNKLHLTLCTLVLTDNVERAEAARIMECCKADVLDPLVKGHSFTVLLSGVEYMNDDPAEVDVLYATVHTDAMFQTLVNAVVDYCAQHGLVDKQYEQVKLHVTIMNTLFRDTKPEYSRNRKIRETFNGRPILELFRNFDFGEVVVDTIHLSTRFTTSKTTGYYNSTTSISMFL